MYKNNTYGTVVVGGLVSVVVIVVIANRRYDSVRDVSNLATDISSLPPLTGVIQYLREEGVRTHL